jgi:uncharacterized UBP type Zn finger protein
MDDSNAVTIPIGLVNHGNSCFVSVILQSLANCNVVYSSIVEEYKRCGKSCQLVTDNGGSISNNDEKTCSNEYSTPCLLCLIEKCILSLRSNETSLTTASAEIKSLIENFSLFPMKVLTKGRQEDCHEFLLNILFAFQLPCKHNGIESTALTTPSSSFYGGTVEFDKTTIDLSGQPSDEKMTAEGLISATSPSIQHGNLEILFQGRISQEIECTLCHSVSSRKETIIDLSLSIQSSSTLESAITDYMKVISFSGTNCYDCSTCEKKTNSFQLLNYLYRPIVMCIQLKRFYLDRNNELKKINHFVSFPLHLSFRLFLQQQQQHYNDNDAESDNENQEEYELKSIIVHKGETMNNGHYVCYLKRGLNK